ncbi:MAG: translation initiation factor IF-3, partial [Oscillospiraceae bacterium]|nr:translation initiation factor IF-3 [Oscillospiraceae bacterium]
MRGCCASALIFPHFSEVFQIANAVHQINEEINDKEVRLIGDDGEQLGIMSAEEALRIATE